MVLLKFIFCANLNLFERTMETAENIEAVCQNGETQNVRLSNE